MIAILEWTKSNVNQNIEQLQTPIKCIYIYIIKYCDKDYELEEW